MTSDALHLSVDRLIALRAQARFAAAPTARAGTLGGDVPTKRRGAGQEVEDIRAYVSGDDIRHIDHLSTARTGELHVRQFREDRSRTCLLVVDFRPPMHWGFSHALFSVAAAEALVLYGWRIIGNGARVGLMATDGTSRVVLRPKAGERAMLAVIGAMVRAHMVSLGGLPDRATPPLDEALSGLEKVAPRGAEIVIASSFDTPGAELAATLADATVGRDLRLMRISDGGLKRLPKGRYRIATRGGHRDVLAIGARADADAMSALPEGWPVEEIDAAHPISAGRVEAAHV